MAKFIDLTGQRFGRLTVVGRAKSKNRHTYWNVRCDCGSEKSVRTDGMTRGLVKACGCLNNEPLGFVPKMAFRKKDPRIVGENHYLWKGGKPKCKECGAKLSTYKNKYILCADCYYKFARGKDSPNWMGGLTPMQHLIRGLLVYRNWRNDVFRKDNYTCQDCGARSGGGTTVVLNADHIKPFAVIIRENKIRTLDEAMQCLDLWLVANGRTLCEDCHRKTDTFGWKTRKLLTTYD